MSPTNLRSAEALRLTAEPYSSIPTFIDLPLLCLFHEFLLREWDILTCTFHYGDLWYGDTGMLGRSRSHDEQIDRGQSKLVKG